MCTPSYPRIKGRYLRYGTTHSGRIPWSSVCSSQSKIHLCSCQQPFAADVGSCPVLSGSLERGGHSLCVFLESQTVGDGRAEIALCGSGDEGSCAERTLLYGYETRIEDRRLIQEIT